MRLPNSLRSIFDVRAHERRIAASMGLYFFLVITSFWILKPLKKTLFLGFYAKDGLDWMGHCFDASEAELLAKVLNMLVAAVAAIVFSLMSRSLRRQQLTYVFTAFFIFAYGIFAVMLSRTTAVGVWSFYLFGDLFNTLMVATFFSFLNDSVSADGAKRLYGVVGFGGVLGGVFGSSAVSLWIGSFSVAAWLWVAAGLGVGIIVAASAAARAIQEPTAKASCGEGKDDRSPPEPRTDIGGNPALAGAALVFRSRYLLSIVALVGLYELVSTILDFQFTSVMMYFSEDGDALKQNFATVYAATNWLSMLVQLFLTSFVMRRFGLSVSLLVLPCGIGLASMGFLLMPVLVLGGMLSVSDNALNYSINQSSKEALYVPTTTEEKYQAKAFIDMFVQRFAKALGVGLGLLVGSLFDGVEAIRWLSILILPALGLWAYASVYAGRQFKRSESRG